jgi:hypothetical protein
MEDLDIREAGEVDKMKLGKTGSMPDPSTGAKAIVVATLIL